MGVLSLGQDICLLSSFISSGLLSLWMTSDTVCRRCGLCLFIPQVSWTDMPFCLPRWRYHHRTPAPPPSPAAPPDTLLFLPPTYQ